MIQRLFDKFPGEYGRQLQDEDHYKDIAADIFANQVRIGARVDQVQGVRAFSQHFKNLCGKYSLQGRSFVYQGPKQQCDRYGGDIIIYHQSYGILNAVLVRRIAEIGHYAYKCYDKKGRNGRQAYWRLERAVFDDEEQVYAAHEFEAPPEKCVDQNGLNAHEPCAIEK